MQLIVNLPEPLLKEVKRIHDNQTTKDLLESKHELSGVYASIAINVLKAYEEKK